MRSRRFQKLLTIALAFSPISVSLADAPASQPADGILASSPDPAVESSLRMRRLANCVYSFVWHHHDHLPRGLGDTLHAKGNRPAWFFTPADEATHAPPTPLTADWLSQNSSWVYLGSDINFNSLPGDQRPNIIIFHSKMDQPFHSSKGNAFILACMADSSVQKLSPDDAQKAIDSSKAAIAAAAQQSATQPSSQNAPEH